MGGLTFLVMFLLLMTLVAVIREMKITHARFGVAVPASTVITDVASLILLAICIQLKRQEIPGRVAGSISVFDHIEYRLSGEIVLPELEEDLA